jgi:urease accessory protein
MPVAGGRAAIREGIMRSRFAAFCGAGLMTLAAGPASAHHVMEGRLPATLIEGLLSGLGHPVIGLDHLAFIVGGGIAVGLLGASIVVPGLLVAASIAGVLVHLGAVDLPGGEFLVAASVVAAGLLIVRGISVPGLAWILLFAFGGFVHGYAFGESIVGADRQALGGYLAGLTIVQAGLATGIAVASRVMLVSGSSPVRRAAGGAIAAVGLFFAAAQALG